MFTPLHRCKRGRQLNAPGALRAMYCRMRFRMPERVPSANSVYLRSVLCMKCRFADRPEFLFHHFARMIFGKCRQSDDLPWDKFKWKPLFAENPQPLFYSIAPWAWNHKRLHRFSHDLVRDAEHRRFEQAIEFEQLLLKLFAADAFP